MSTPPKILFLCTANYYRSRFAEEYFNHLAACREVDARADSAGLEMAQWRSYNPGELSVHSIKELAVLGVDLMPPYRAPKQFESEVIDQFDRIIALSESEHRPMATRHFPEVVEHFEFWTVEDVEFEDPESALARIKANVEALIADL